jgi:hypothetical protein
MLYLNQEAPRERPSSPKAAQPSHSDGRLHVTHLLPTNDPFQPSRSRRSSGRNLRKRRPPSIIDIPLTQYPTRNRPHPFSPVIS